MKRLPPTNCSQIAQFLVLLFCLISTQAFSAQKPLPGLSGAVLDEGRLAKFKAAAIDGDGQLALRLSAHYLLTGDRKNAIEWARVSAENGHVDGQYQVGYLLRETDDADARRRGVFWLKKAAARGFAPAKDALKRIQAPHG
jgi:TPR repeat protein